RQNLVYEKDRVVNRFVFGFNSNPGDTEEQYFWDGIQLQSTIPVAAPGRLPLSDVDVCVETQEDNDNRPFSLFVKDAGGQNVFLATQPGTIPPMLAPPRRLTTCGTMPSGSIGPGDLQVVMSAPSNFTRTPFLDLIRLQYDAGYTAEGNS